MTVTVPVRGGLMWMVKVRDCPLSSDPACQRNWVLVCCLSGLGRTLADGHSHETRWRGDDIDRQVELIEQGAVGRKAAPPREALVQVVEITDDAEAAAHRLAARFGSTERDVLSSPYVWIGTEGEILAAMADHERRWGITRYVVREPALDAAENLITRLHRGSGWPVGRAS
ncbi:hypothetical protein ACFQ0G_22785 [Streptomyces chiangmaiensis]